MQPEPPPLQLKKKLPSFRCLRNEFVAVLGGNRIQQGASNFGSGCSVWVGPTWEGPSLPPSASISKRVEKLSKEFLASNNIFACGTDADIEGFLGESDPTVTAPQMHHHLSEKQTDRTEEKRQRGGVGGPTVFTYRYMYSKHYSKSVLWPHCRMYIKQKIIESTFQYAAPVTSPLDCDKIWTNKLNKQTLNCVAHELCIRHADHARKKA